MSAEHPIVNCPSGRETAIKMLKLVLSAVKAGDYDVLFTQNDETGRELLCNGRVNCAIGDEIGVRGIQVTVAVAPFGEVFR